MTKWRVDNLITHIAALALVVDGFEVDIYDLKEDLRLETKEYVYPYPSELSLTKIPQIAWDDAWL